MLKITREKAINMLVDYELDSMDSDEPRESYADMITNGAKGYNDLTDENLANEVEIIFDETDGIRIVPPNYAIEMLVEKAIECIVASELTFMITEGARGYYDWDNLELETELESVFGRPFKIVG